MDTVLVSSLLAHQVFDDEQTARDALQAALCGLAAGLHAPDQPWFRSIVPESFRPALSESAAPERGSLEAFYSRYAARRGLPEGHAIEEAQVVLRTFVRHLEAAERQRLIDRLPDALGGLVEQVLEEPRPMPPHASPAPRFAERTLAGGRPPGPTRTLAEAHAGSDRPLYETPTSEGPDRSLAGGRSGSEHPLSEAHKGAPKGRRP